MAGRGWHDLVWKSSLALLRGDNVDRLPIGYLPDRGSQKQRNHRWLAACAFLLWYKKNGVNRREDLDAISTVRDWTTKAIDQELTEGLGTHAGAVEIFMPDPHTAYDLLPRLVFLTDAIDRGSTDDANKYRTLLRWQLFGWQAGSTPDGQVVLPCTRLVTPLSQVADACNRFLLNLPHRNNKWKPKTWDQWFKLHKDNPNAQLWVAEYFRRALEKYGKEGLLQLESRPNLEPPLLAWPIQVNRHGDSHIAIMIRNPVYNGIEPCYYVRADYRVNKHKPTDGITYNQTEQEKSYPTREPIRMALRTSTPI